MRAMSDLMALCPRCRTEVWMSTAICPGCQFELFTPAPKRRSGGGTVAVILLFASALGLAGRFLIERPNAASLDYGDGRNIVRR